MKSVKNMSIAVDEQFKEKLERAAKNSGRSTSSLTRHIIEKYVPIELNEGLKINFVLGVPVELKGKENEQALRDWLSTRVESIVGALTKEVKDDNL